MIQRATGKQNIVYLPKTASTAYTAGTLVYPDGTGGLTVTASISAIPAGIIQRTVTSQDVDYALTTKVPVDVFEASDTFTVDTTGGTATASTVGNTYNLDSTRGYVDLTTTVPKGIARVVSLDSNGKVLVSFLSSNVVTSVASEQFSPTYATTINAALLGDSRLALQNGTILNLNSISWNGGGSSASGEIRFGFSVPPNLRVGMKIRYVGTTGDASVVCNGTYTITKCITTSIYACAISTSIASGTGTTGTLTNLECFVDAGWVHWASGLSNQRLRIVYNGGQGGDRAATAASRVSEITSRTDVQYCFVDVGINDYNGVSASTATPALVNTTTASVLASIDTICKALKAANITPVLMNMYGVSSDFSGAANIMIYVTQHNNLLANYAASHSNIILIDQASVTTDPTSGYLLGGTLGNAWTPDGIHPARMLGRSVGKLVSDTFSGAVGVPTILTKGLFDNARNNASNYNVIQNAPWVNTGGTVTAATTGTNIGTSAQGWYVTRTVTTGATATFTNGSANIGWTAHGLALNDSVLFTTSGSLPTNFATSTRYYVVSVVDANTITVSATQGGGAITAGSAGSGTQTGYRASVCSVVARTYASDGDAIGYNQVVDYTSNGASDVLDIRIVTSNDATYDRLMSAGTYELRGTMKLTGVASSGLKSISTWSYLTFIDSTTATSYTNVAQIVNASASDSSSIDTTLAGNVSSADFKIVIRSAPMTLSTAPTSNFGIGIRNIFTFGAAGTNINIAMGRFSLVRVA